MKKIILALILSLTPLFAKEYGSPLTLKKQQSLSEVIQSGTDKEVLIKAKVGKVCEAKGCWIGLVNEKEDIRVTFKDYAFFVPISLIGKDVLVQGKIHKKKMSIKEAKHFAKDAGKDPSKVTTPKIEYRIVASGVRTL